LNGILTGDWSKAGFEKQVIDETRKKALEVGSDSAGGFLVPTQFVTSLIEQLRANTVVLNMGATMLTPTASSPIKIPRQSSGATAYWLDENQEITASQQSLEQITLQPKMVAGLVKVSQRLVALSNPSVEAMIRNDLALALAEAIDIKALEGDGASNTPVGITNQSGVTTTASSGANGDEFTYDKAIDLEGSVDDANALRGDLSKFGYVIRPDALRRMKKQKIPQYSGQTDGEPIFAPMVNDAMIADQLGYKIGKTTQLGNAQSKGANSDLSNVIFGNWAELIFAQWGSLSIDVSTQAGDSNGGAFTSNQAWFKAVTEMDVNLRHGASFAVASEIRTAN
jgi:HK97 family phage major capsid protein